MFNIFRTEFSATDWESVWHKLYPAHAKFEELPEWGEESQRVHEFDNYFDPILKEMEQNFG